MVWERFNSRKKEKEGGTAAFLRKKREEGWKRTQKNVKKNKGNR